MKNEHTGQFAIIRTSLELDGFSSLAIGDGWMLNWHNKLKMHMCSENGFILLGYAWQVRADREEPYKELSKLSRDAGRDEIMAVEESWCGRYLLICGSMIFTDTSTLIPVYYSEAGLSSDILLLADIMGLDERIYRAGDIITWMPGPLTQYDEIRKLLPSQLYDYESREILARQLLPVSFIHETDHEKTVSRFVDSFACSLKNLSYLFPERRLLIALTGGYDSRVLLAILEYAGLSYSAFTLGHSNLSQGDADIPKIICETLGSEYIYIDRDPESYSREAEEEYIRHVAGLVKDEDRLFYAYGQYGMLQKMAGEIAVLRGGIWEAVTEFFGKEFTTGGPHKDLPDHFELETDSAERKSLKEYFCWMSAYPQNGITPCDRFYWEQRGGCWLSPMEQGFDLLDRTLEFQPLNCRLLIAMLLDFPREERLKKTHEADIVRYACPQIAEIPYGGIRPDGKNTVSFIKRKTIRLAESVRRIGLIKTFRKYAYYYIVRNISKD